MSNSLGCIQLQYRKCAVLACVCSNCEQFTSWMLMKKRPNLNVVCIVTHGADTRSIIARHDPIITDIITDNNQFLRCLGRATQRCRARSLHYSARQRWGLASVLELAILTMIMQCWKCQHENHNAFLSFNIPSGIEFQLKCYESAVVWAAVRLLTSAAPDTITRNCATLIFMDIKYGFGDQWSMTGPTNK